MARNGGVRYGLLFAVLFAFVSYTTGGSVAGELRAQLVDEQKNKEAFPSKGIAAFAEKACPEQLGHCKMDKECGREIDRLIETGRLIAHREPINAAAQELVQCVSSNMPQNRLQLRSKQSVKQEAFGGVLHSKANVTFDDDPHDFLG
jgi:hypothetical protein